MPKIIGLAVIAAFIGSAMALADDLAEMRIAITAAQRSHLCPPNQTYALVNGSNYCRASRIDRAT
jgi:hypothetical protein